MQVDIKSSQSDNMSQKNHKGMQSNQKRGMTEPTLNITAKHSQLSHETSYPSATEKLFSTIITKYLIFFQLFQFLLQIPDLIMSIMKGKLHLL